ncbi:hypothetical protein HMPREF0501_00261 [Limosilactobacillus coleohominis 101-4-CHN]|uniref:Uncharacterized protein n=1 Tax=Limosilactobacillus coleohominis 101-4-CHN TaxID=575594 RepID=C7XU95_9LACO|nr:hypothetical protein [Limosilactobacillus coleohominis]EEU30856.1 hypothetical protein HMPREF0501_00261 [Limosilactobacillus coleohominis 101-4-CHN]
MKYSKWQGYSLWISVISGAVIICSGNPIQAAENTDHPTTTAATVPLPQTKRIIEITSTDGTVHQQQTDLVSWRGLANMVNTCALVQLNYPKLQVIKIMRMD